MNNFPRNPAILLKLSEIGNDLTWIQSTSMFARTITDSVKTGQISTAIKMIYDQSKLNRPLTAHIVGEKTLEKIESLFATMHLYA